MEQNLICDCNIIHVEVVDKVREKMQSKDDYLHLSDLFKVFGDGTRLQILHALEQSEMCVCDIANLLDMTKSSISHQLKNLRMSNLVKSRRDGQNVYYSLADDHVKQILDIGFEHIFE